MPTPDEARQLLQETLARAKSSQIPQQLQAITPDGVEHLVQELHVHQIELEMQNEELHRIQAELEDARARYFDLYDLAPVGYCTISEKGLILEANLTAATLLGLTRAALVNQPFSRFILPADWDVYYLQNKQLFETHPARLQQGFDMVSTSSTHRLNLSAQPNGSGQVGKPQGCELRMLRKDGSQFWARIETTVAQAPSVNSGQSGDFGAALVSRVVLSDITEQKQAEQALRESELKYRSLIESSSDAIFCVDQNGQYQFTNHVFASSFGKSPDYFIGKTFWDIYPKKHADLRYEVTQRVFQMGESVSLDVEVPLPDKTLYFHARNNPIKNETGKVILMLTHSTDITARKQAEDALRESEERYRSLFNGMLDGYYCSTHAGKFVEVNPAMVRMFGYSNEEEMLAVDIKKELYFAPEERGSHVLDTGHEEVEVYRMRRKDGTEMWVEDHGSYVHDEQGRIIFHQGIMRDVTERKQTEETLQRAKEMLERANRELEQTLVREQQLSRIDGLTGLYNRRYFFELATREFGAALRYRHPLAMLMFDTDGLKQANDTFGHVAGDRLLALVAQTAAAQIRVADVLARYGGDEFVLLLPQTSAELALPIAERIREGIAALRMETDKGLLSVTLSIGIAEIGHVRGAGQIVDKSVENVIQRADKALYTAKAEGRNRTLVYSVQMQGNE